MEYVGERRFNLSYMKHRTMMGSLRKYDARKVLGDNQNGATIFASKRNNWFCVMAEKSSIAFLISK